MDIRDQNWTFIDVETANSARASICALGIICFRSGKEVFRKHYLIDPETDFAPMNIKIHGITPVMVAGKPTFPQVWNEIVPWTNHSVFIAHNAKSMDICAILKSLERYHMTIPRILYYDTLEISRRCLPDQKSYKLTNLCTVLELPILKHHDPLDDAQMCANLFQYLIANYPVRGQDIHITDYVPSAPGEYCFCQPVDDQVPPISAQDVYDRLLAAYPDTARAFPELKKLTNGTSLYFYKQRAAMFDRLKSRGLYIELDVESVDDPLELFLDFERKNIKPAPIYRFYLSARDNLDPLLALLHDICNDKYYSANVESFGCCNDFVRCSDAGHCLRMDDWEYVGCAYRRNLDKGRIFYGENKNKG